MMTVGEGTAAQHARLKNMRRPITVLSILFVAVLTMGFAVIERMEHRAQQDRFTLGGSTGYTPQ